MTIGKENFDLTKEEGRQTLVLCWWPCIVIVNRKALYMDIGMPKEYITLKELLK